jgi:hypothetical protein
VVTIERLPPLDQPSIIDCYLIVWILHDLVVGERVLTFIRFHAVGSSWLCFRGADCRMCAAAQPRRSMKGRSCDRQGRLLGGRPYRALPVLALKRSLGSDDSKFRNQSLADQRVSAGAPYPVLIAPYVET